eukprot:gene289-162_t
MMMGLAAPLFPLSHLSQGNSGLPSLLLTDCTYEATSAFLRAATQTPPDLNALRAAVRAGADVTAELRARDDGAGRPYLSPSARRGADAQRGKRSACLHCTALLVLSLINNPLLNVSGISSVAGQGRGGGNCHHLCFYLLDIYLSFLMFSGKYSPTLANTNEHKQRRRRQVSLQDALFYASCGLAAEEEQTLLDAVQTRLRVLSDFPLFWFCVVFFSTYPAAALAPTPRTVSLPVSLAKAPASPRGITRRPILHCLVSYIPPSLQPQRAVGLFLPHNTQVQYSDPVDPRTAGELGRDAAAFCMSIQLPTFSSGGASGAGGGPPNMSLTLSHGPLQLAYHLLQPLQLAYHRLLQPLQLAYHHPCSWRTLQPLQLAYHHPLQLAYHRLQPLQLAYHHPLQLAYHRLQPLQLAYHHPLQLAYHLLQPLQLAYHHPLQLAYHHPLQLAYHLLQPLQLAYHHPLQLAYHRLQPLQLAYHHPLQLAYHLLQPLQLAYHLLQPLQLAYHLLHPCSWPPAAPPVLPVSVEEWSRIEAACRERIPSETQQRYLSVDEMIREQVLKLFVECNYDVLTLLTSVVKSLQHIGRHDVGLLRNENNTAFTLTQSIAYGGRGADPRLPLVERRRREVAESVARINAAGGAAPSGVLGVTPEIPSAPSAQHPTDTGVFRKTAYEQILDSLAAYRSTVAGRVPGRPQRVPGPAGRLPSAGRSRSRSRSRQPAGCPDSFNGNYILSRGGVTAVPHHCIESQLFQEHCIKTQHLMFEGIIRRCVAFFRLLGLRGLLPMGNSFGRFPPSSLYFSCFVLPPMRLLHDCHWLLSSSQSLFFFLFFFLGKGGGKKRKGRQVEAFAAASKLLQNRKKSLRITTRQPLLCVSRLSGSSFAHPSTYPGWGAMLPVPGASPTSPRFEVRHKVYALLQGTYRHAVVTDVGVDTATHEPIYYVHYVDQDSRLDRWLPARDVRERHQGRGPHHAKGAAVPHFTSIRQRVQLTAASPLTGGGAEWSRPPSTGPQSSPRTAPGGPASPASPLADLTGLAPMGVGVPTAGSPSVASPVLSAAPSKGGGGAAGTQRISTVRARRDSSFFSRTKNIHSICIGPHEVETWYFSPYHLARPAVHQGLRQAVEGDSGRGRVTTLTAPPPPSGPPPSAAASSFGSAGTCDAPATVPSTFPPPSLAAPATAAPATAAPDALAVSAVTQGFALHLCPYCLHPFLDHEAVVRHLCLTCERHPPGNEVYRDPVRRLVVLEMDGKLEPTFCEHLALLSKLFLEHKALDHDMTPFLFYTLCGIEPHGLPVLGYFSKEKINPDQYNLSCILVLPQYQGRGVGRFLIEMRKGGHPEKPLSDLGAKLYGSYWGDAVLMAMARAAEEGHCATVDYLVQATSMTQADILRTLQLLGLVTNVSTPSSCGAGAGAGAGAGGVGGVLPSAAAGLSSSTALAAAGPGSSGGAGAGDSGSTATTPCCVVSAEALQRCSAKRRRREADVSTCVFFPHLLHWRPEQYEHLSIERPRTIYTALDVDAKARRHGGATEEGGAEGGPAARRLKTENTKRTSSTYPARTIRSPASVSGVCLVESCLFFLRTLLEVYRLPLPMQRFFMRSLVLPRAALRSTVAPPSLVTGRRLVSEKAAACDTAAAGAKPAPPEVTSRTPTPQRLEEIANTFSQLTLREITELQRLLFKKLGHSDDFYEKALLQGLGGGGGGGGVQAAPAAAAAAAAAAAPTAAAAPPPKPEKKKVEKLTSDVKLGPYAPEIKIKLIKELRTVTSMSIADAKKAVEKCPGLVATNLSKADADKLKTAFEKLGAKVELL